MVGGMVIVVPNEGPKTAGLTARLKRNTFELRGDIIVRDRGASESDFVRVGDMESWTDFGDPWIYVILMQLRDGRKVEWIDPYSELGRILFQVASERIIIGY